MRVALVTGEHRPDLRELPEATDRPLVDALRRRGVEVVRPSWTDPGVAWDAYDLAVVRTTWDYTADRDGFVAWARATSRRTRVCNAADVLRWNTHKSYLLELEERGAPVVPTAWLARGDHIGLAELLAARGWDRAVVKPAVAAGSDGLLRVGDPTGEPGQRHLDRLLSAGDVLVQPYLASIETRGELSVVVVEGEVTHAVRKTPQSGEFRIQEQFGGRYAEEGVGGEVAALARWIVEAAGADLLVARVDLVEADDGALQLAELEATEPDLYLSVVPRAAEPLAAAIVARAGG